jgi:hypothetical protein
MTSEVVAYELDDSSLVRFEIDGPDEFQSAGGEDKAAGKVRKAIGPAVDAAMIVLDKVREAAPDEVEVTFGVKVSGGMEWIIARAATEANFEIKLTWRPARPKATEAAAEIDQGDNGAAAPGEKP